MPIIKAKFIISPDALTVRDLIKSAFPHLSSHLDNMIKRVRTYKYGVDNKELNIQYRFISRDTVYKYFDTIFSLEKNSIFDGSSIDDYVARTINALPSTLSETADAVTIFQTVAVDRFITPINKSISRNNHFVSIVAGPTGAGKTAFSKGLFSAAIRLFWESKYNSNEG